MDSNKTPFHPSLDPANKRKERPKKTPHIYTPWSLAGETEHSHQAAFFCWANFAARFGYAAAAHEGSYRAVADYIAKHGQPAGSHGFGFIPFPVPVLTRLHAIPNGGQRDKVTAGQLRAEGVKTGVPDVFLPRRGWKASGHIAYCGLYLEFKKEMYRTRKNGGRSDEQVDWADYLTNAGYSVKLVYNWIEAADAVTSYVNSVA